MLPERVSLHRDCAAGSYTLPSIVTGLEHAPVLSFAGDTVAERAAFLSTVNVELVEDGVQNEYMWVRNGILHIACPYWKTGDERFLYLDVVHELVHVKQFREGRELYDDRYSYTERPTEVEAYTVCVEEARRINLSTGLLQAYLYVPWISDEEYFAFLNRFNVPRPRTVPPTVSTTHSR